jgi:hypothetical protein
MAAKPGKTARKLKIKIIKGFIDIQPDPTHPDGKRKQMFAGGEILDPPAQASSWVEGKLAEWLEVEEPL